MPGGDVLTVSSRQHAVIGKLQTVLSCAVATREAEGVTREGAVGVVAGGSCLEKNHVLQVVILDDLTDLSGNLLVHVTGEGSIHVLGLGGLLQNIVVIHAQNRRKLGSDQDVVFQLLLGGDLRYDAGGDKDAVGRCAGGQKNAVAVEDLAAIRHHLGFGRDLVLHLIAVLFVIQGLEFQNTQKQKQESGQNHQANYARALHGCGIGGAGGC